MPVETMPLEQFIGILQSAMAKLSINPPYPTYAKLLEREADIMQELNKIDSDPHINLLRYALKRLSSDKNTDKSFP